MTNGSESGDAQYTTAMLIVLGCLLVSAAVWFAVGSMKTTALAALSSVALAGGSGQVNPAPNGSETGQQTLTFTLQGQTFSRPILGEADAQVVVAEFSDYQCPYCMQAVPTIQQLERQGNVKVVHMNFVVHAGARLAALASECAGEQGQYWAMHDAIFTQNKYDKAGLLQTAASVGLDAAKMDACLSSGKYESAVDSQQTAGEKAGVEGTPTFIIGKIRNGKLVGKSVVGALPLSDFESEVRAAMNS